MLPTLVSATHKWIYLLNQTKHTMKKIFSILLVVTVSVVGVAFLYPAIAKACDGTMPKNEFTCQCNGGYYCQSNGCNVCNSPNNVVTNAQGQVVQPNQPANGGATN